MRLVSVAMMLVFGGITVGCAAVAPRPPPPILAPVGPADAIRVQFVGAAATAHDLWVCGRGEVVGRPELGLSCIPYVVFMEGMEGQP